MWNEHGVHGIISIKQHGVGELNGRQQRGGWLTVDFGFGLGTEIVSSNSEADLGG